MTYRERRERRAERLHGWAEKRESDAAAVLKSHEVYRGDHAFNFQPGHIPERARVIAQADRAFESLDKARGMESRADGIDYQLETSIYDDDPDAIERLKEKLAGLEATRDKRKEQNAGYRKAHRAELKAMTPYERSRAVPFPSYSLSNLSGNITRTRQRIARLESVAVQGERPRMMLARFSSVCDECGEMIEKGSPILYFKAERRAIHADEGKLDDVRPVEP